MLQLRVQRGPLSLVTLSCVLYADCSLSHEVALCQHCKCLDFGFGDLGNFTHMWQRWVLGSANPAHAWGWEEMDLFLGFESCGAPRGTGDFLLLISFPFSTENKPSLKEFILM